MVPEFDGDIVSLLKGGQPIQAPPVVGVHDDQSGDAFQVHFPEGAQFEKVPVEGQKVLHIGTQLTGEDPDGPGIQEGSGHQGGEGIKIGIGVGEGYLHGAT
jgi:hypothetical protein